MTAGPVLLIKVTFMQGCREFLGGLSPCCFKTGGGFSPLCPPCSAAYDMYTFYYMFVCVIVYQPCENGAIRIVYSSNPLRGQAQVCNDGTWYSICDRKWDNTDAGVFCRQLGFPAEGWCL